MIYADSEKHHFGVFHYPLLFAVLLVEFERMKKRGRKLTTLAF